MKSNSIESKNLINFKLFSSSSYCIDNIKYAIKLLFLLFIFVCNECSEDGIKIKENKDILSTRTIYNGIEKYKQVNCNSTNGCYIPDTTCICRSSSCCTRKDLDPCDYSDGLEFAKAVACELTKLANGCIEQNYQYGCIEVGSPICLDLGDPTYTTVPTSLTNIVSGGNPFQFCSEAGCNEYTCDSGSYPLYHFKMTIAYKMLSYLG